MTIPTRPAPAPPGSIGQNAAAGANASLERLRLQLQQQHQEQQQQNGLLIKLPPPPKGPTINNNSNNNSNTTNTSSITRKFPPARYSPALTSWNDSPFEMTKKVPPPRPPPPRISTTRTKAPAQSSTTGNSDGGLSGGVNLLSNIFQRKKVVKSNSTTNASRVYNVSSGAKTSKSSSKITTTNYGTHIATPTTTTADNSFANDWNSSWNTTNTNNNNGFTITLPSKTTAIGNNSNHHNHHQQSLVEAQLINFDSPPSSPTFTQKSNSDCVSVDSFSSDSNFSSPNNGSVSQPESGFEDDFSAIQQRSRPPTTSPLDPWESGVDTINTASSIYSNTTAIIGTAPVRNLNNINQRNSDNPLCNGKNLLPPTPSLTAPTIIKPKISQKPKAPKPPMLLKQNVILSPPMPQFPPPPAPQTNDGTSVSILDVIAGKVDALHLGSASNSYACEETLQQAYGIALYDFNGMEEGDLCFRENEKIYILEEINAEWYRGRTRAGCEGIFPSNYIDIKVPINTNPITTTTTTTATTITNNMKDKTLCVKSLYNFAAEVQGDLALKEDEYVKILYRINDDWLYGETNDGRQGQFPINFLEYIPDNIPSLP